MAQGFPDMGRKSVIQQTIEQERLAGLRDPEGQAAFKRGVGTGSYFIPGTAQVKAGVGILGKLAPAANQVYRAITGRKSFKKDFAPVVEAYDSPTANILGLGFIGMTAPDKVAEIPEALEKNQVGRALANTGYLGLESLALPSFLKKSSKAKFLPVGVGNFINKSGDMVGKVTRPSKAIVPKVVGIGSSIIGGETLAATLDPDTTLRDQGVKKDDATVKTQTPKSDDDILKAAIDADRNVDTIPLDQQVKSNVVNQDLIPDVDMSDFKKGTAGDAGPTGTDAESMNMSLAKLTDDKDDSPATEYIAPENDREIVKTEIDNALYSNSLSLASVRDTMKKMPPSNFHAIKSTIDENFDATEEKIAQMKERLDETEIKTFEEFRNEFKEMSGYDGNQKQLDYIILKMGLDMLSGRSYEQGLSGFLDILGRAGGTAVDSAMEILESEKALNEGLALKYMEYEQDMDKYLLEEDKEILNAQIGNLQNKNKSTLEAYQTMYDAEFALDEAYYKMLLNKTEKETGVDLSLLDKTLNVQVRNDSFYRGVQNFVGKRQKGTGILFVEHKGQFVPFNNLFGKDISYEEFDIDKTARTKAQTKMDYAYAGIELTQDFFALNQNLKSGPQTAIAKGISGGVGIELAIKSMLGVDLTEKERKGKGTSYVQNLQKLMNNDIYYGADIEELLIANADPEDKDNILEDYRAEMNKARQAKGGSFIANLYASVYGGNKNDTDYDEKIARVKDALSRYEIIQVKMKYIIANANKAEDRLTQKDIEEAGKLTEISKFLEDPTIIERKYKQLGLELNQKFNNAMDVLLENGTGDQIAKFVARYPKARSIIKYKLKIKELQKQEKTNDPNISLDVLKSITGL
jgi:hypothetical protein